MKVISFNANGIRSAARNGFYEWLVTQDADFVCIQETKVQPDQLIPEETYYPRDYFVTIIQLKRKDIVG
ncbi:exodeoxyribonuclease [Legionella sainthelensi]|nr:exodeoxyribonuclease [Legionella sainthelensi]